MARTDPQFNFRIPAALKEKLEESAKINGRSVTAEVITRLESTFHSVDRYENKEIALKEIIIESLDDLRVDDLKFILHLIEKLSQKD